jgi:hypothetical protein
MIWPFLKDKGAFLFIYTNDQRSKKTEYINHFPAVDYYVYQKGGDQTSCDTKNVFFGEITGPKNIKLDYKLNYLPSLITKETLDILRAVTSVKGDKPDFSADRKLSFGKTLYAEESKGMYKYIYSANKNGPIYAYSNTKIENVELDKVILNYDGGIDAYYVEFLDADAKIGSAHMTMYSKTDSRKEGKHLERFFNSDIVKFIFLITQYSVPPNTKNEPLVANSITIPPNDITDYYKFFDIEEHKQYIEDALKQYDNTKTKQPTNANKQTRNKKNKGGCKKTRRKR